MPESTVHWLLDVGLPPVRPNGHGLDIIHAAELEHRPGHVGITQAMHLGRALVTLDQGFRGSWQLPIRHHGVVILEGSPGSGEEVVRNLSHLLFCLHHCAGPDMAGQRYVMRGDRAILRVLPDGSEEEIEKWKQPRVLAVV